MTMEGRLDGAWTLATSLLTRRSRILLALAGTGLRAGVDALCSGDLRSRGDVIVITSHLSRCLMPMTGSRDRHPIVHGRRDNERPPLNESDKEIPWCHDNTTRG